MEYKNITKLKDFYCSAVLRAMGFQLLRLERHANDITSFVFADPHNKANDAIVAYWDRKAPIDARTLFDAIKELKSRLHGPES